MKDKDLLETLDARRKTLDVNVPRPSSYVLRNILHQIFFIFFLSLFITGCTTYNAATGRREFIVVSTPEEVALGQRIHGDLTKQQKFTTDKNLAERVIRIGERVAQVSDRQDYQYHFFVVENEDLNAFTTPGGNIYFHTGLLKKLKTDDQVAGVLAHEIGHCAARHTIKKFQAVLSYNIIQQIALSQLNVSDTTRVIAGVSSNVLMGLVFSAYSRQDELQADKLGVKYLHLAGYDVNAMAESLEILKAESKDSKVPVILRSHPHLDDRIVAVKKEVENIKNTYPKDQIKN